MASKKNPFTLEEGHVVSEAFKTKDGIQYYYIKDVFNTFASRALDALAIYEQWAMRCTNEYLRGHFEATNKILSDPAKINIVELVKLNSNLGERLNFALPTEDLIWNFGAVVYFDENESPYRYDPEYAKEKIAKWKKDLSIADFFFKTPIGELIPSPKLSEADLKTYFQVMKKIDSQHLKQILGILSPQMQNKDFYQALLSQGSLQQTTTG